MEMREAREADAEQLAALADAPQDVMQNLVHDRTVRVLEGDEEILGFVSFDARERTVHITQLDGDESIYDDLLAEPLRFARSESMAVELLVPETEPAVGDAATAAGFERVGHGPQFDGESTIRYRIDSP